MDQRAKTWRRLTQFHRNQQGGMLDYAMVFAFLTLPLIIPFWMVDGERRSIMGLLFQVLSDYFGMIAFYVGWPFL